MKKLMTVALAATALQAGAAEFRLPAYETTTLPNGLTVILMERHEVPLVSVRAVVKAGAVHDAAKAGLADMTGDAVLLGTARHTKAQIDQAFDFRGADISGGSGAEQSGVFASFKTEDTPALLPLFAEIVQQPGFDKTEVDKLRDRKVDELKQAKEHPRNVVQNYYRAMLFGSTPYAIRSPSISGSRPPAAAAPAAMAGSSRSNGAGPAPAAQLHRLIPMRPLPKPTPKRSRMIRSPSSSGGSTGA